MTCWIALTFQVLYSMVSQAIAAWNMVLVGGS